MKIQLGAFLIAGLLSTVYSEGSVEFCYNLPQCNASMWSTIAPHECNGTSQSPINIVTANVKPDSSLTAFNLRGFNDSANLLNIINNGKTVQIEIDSQNMSVSGGGLENQYNSTQFHFHWGNGTSMNGSEHTVDGKQYAMEMHIVNLRTDLTASAALNNSKGFAVLGFFIEATNETGKPESWKNLTRFLANITNKGDTMDIMSQLTVDSLIQGVNLSNYYRYQGSLTTPTCNEIVVWTVFKDPIKVSQDLISLFSNTVHINKTVDPFIANNFRPVQALNNRVVTSQPTPTQGPSASTPSAGPLHTLSFSTALLCYVLFLTL